MQNLWEFKIWFDIVMSVLEIIKLFKPTAFRIWIKIQKVDPLFIASLPLEARTAKR